MRDDYMLEVLHRRHQLLCIDAVRVYHLDFMIRTGLEGIYHKLYQH